MKKKKKEKKKKERMLLENGRVDKHRWLCFVDFWICGYMFVLNSAKVGPEKIVQVR